jgi:hypothetical protein
MRRGSAGAGMEYHGHAAMAGPERANHGANDRFTNCLLSLIRIPFVA